MKKSNTYHPFFRPLWRRIALVASCLLWAGFEAYMGNNSWTLIMLAVSAYAAWAYLIAWQEPETTPDDGAPGDQT